MYKTRPAKSLFLLSFIAFCWQACVPLAQQGTGAADSGASEYYADTQLRYEDYVYDPTVKSVQFYQASGHPEEVLTPPVMPLTQEQPLVLEFDQLNTPQQRFVV